MLILAEELFDTLERDRIDIPCISGDVSDTKNPAITRGMEPVIHICAETECDEFAAFMPIDEPVIAQQVFQTVGESLRLNRLVHLQRTEGTNYCVTWARDDTGIRIYRPRALAKLPH